MTHEQALRKAMRRAFSLGETYWQQADSESYVQNRKSHETKDKFDALVEETIAALTAPAQAEPVADELAELKSTLAASREGVRYWTARYAWAQHLLVEAERLCMEHCPNEMSQELRDDWERHQLAIPLPSPPTNGDSK